MKKIVRALIFLSFLTIALFVGKSKWIEFCKSAASKCNSYQPCKKGMVHVRKVLGMLPFAATHHVLANLYLNDGLEDQAIEEYKKTLQMDKRFVQAYLTLANVYLRRRSFKEASELMRKAEGVISDNPDIKNLAKQVSLEYFLDAGMKVLEKGDRLKARELLNNALEVDPNSAQAHYLLALSFDARQDFYRVEDHLKEAIGLDPKFYQAHKFLGDVYFGKGDFEEAIEQYQFSLAIKNDDASALNNMGLANMNLERYGSAISSLEKATALDPDNVETRHNLAAVCRDYGLWDKAVSGFISVVHRNPCYPDVHNDLGEIYENQGRVQEALKEYRASIECGQKRLSQNSRDPLLLVELAQAYSGIKEFERAKKLVERVLMADPHNQKAYFTLANIYRSSDRPEAALATLEKAKKLSSKKYLFLEETIADIKEQMSRSKL